MAGEPPRIITRRELLAGVGAVGAAAIVVQETPAAIVTQDVARDIGLAPQAAAAAQAAPREVLEHLTAAEADTLQAIVARLIPSDANGPGAKEAGAARYIDRALGGALAESRQAYAGGLAALDRYAHSSRQKAFHELPPADQDAILTEVEKGSVADFPRSGAFFEMVRTHTIQGTFCDPFYGGNVNFIGWDMIGYPGVRVSVSADDQRMSQPPTRVHRSAYDYGMFTKASASAKPAGREDSRGD